MRIALIALIATPLLTSPLLAQADYASIAAQQPAWVRPPDRNALGFHTPLEGQEGPVPNKPFSAIEVRHSQQTLADGSHIDHDDKSRFYRDTQGRMRVEGANVIVLFDPTINTTYTIHLQEKNYEQTPAVYRDTERSYPTKIVTDGSSGYISATYPGGPLENDIRHFSWGPNIPYRFQPTSHVETVQLGAQNINGIVCKGTRVTLTIPAHAVGNDRELHVVNTRWYSDDLMVLVQSSNKDPRFGDSTYELKEIKRAEPDSSLFKLPEGFTPSSRSWSSNP